MTENNKKGRMPDFKGFLKVAAWENTDEDGKTYVSIVLGNRVNLYPVEEESDEPVIEDIYN